jgi:cold shock CspA family protein
MPATTSAEAYAHYRQLCGGAPVLSENELRMEVHAAGLHYEELDDTFWTALFRRPDHRQLQEYTAPRQEPSISQGTIHGLQIARGLGVIRPAAGGADLPFQRSALAAGAYEELREGQWVTFEVVPDPRGSTSPQAVHIQLVAE